MQDPHFFIKRSRKVIPLRAALYLPVYLQISNDDRTCQFITALYFTEIIKHHHRVHLFCIMSFIFPFIINTNKLTLFSISNTVKTPSNWTNFSVIPWSKNLQEFDLYIVYKCSLYIYNYIKIHNFCISRIIVIFQLLNYASIMKIWTAI